MIRNPARTRERHTTVNAAEISAKSRKRLAYVELLKNNALKKVKFSGQTIVKRSIAGAEIIGADPNETARKDY